MAWWQFALSVAGGLIFSVGAFCIGWFIAAWDDGRDQRKVRRLQRSERRPTPTVRRSRRERQVDAASDTYYEDGCLLRDLPDEDVAWLADNGWVRAKSEKLGRESPI